MYPRASTAAASPSAASRLQKSAALVAPLGATASTSTVSPSAWSGGTPMAARAGSFCSMVQAGSVAVPSQEAAAIARPP